MLTIIPEMKYLLLDISFHPGVRLSLCSLADRYFGSSLEIPDDCDVEVYPDHVSINGTLYSTKFLKSGVYNRENMRHAEVNDKYIIPHPVRVNGWSYDECMRGYDLYREGNRCRTVALVNDVTINNDRTLNIYYTYRKVDTNVCLEPNVSLPSDIIPIKVVSAASTIIALCEEGVIYQADIRGLSRNIRFAILKGKRFRHGLDDIPTAIGYMSSACYEHNGCVYYECLSDFLEQRGVLLHSGMRPVGERRVKPADC